MRLSLYFLTLFLCINIHAQERILNFDSFITINKDHTITVQEDIEVNVENKKIRRGIFREIPLKRRLSNGKIQTSAIRVLSVKRNNRSEKFHTKSISGRGIHIRIGNKDRYVKKGIHKYSITYKINRQLRKLTQDSTELFWNVTGSFWDFPIENSSVTIKTQDSTSLSFINAFTGKIGEKGEDYEVLSDEGEVSAQVTRELGNREGWSIGVSFPTSYLKEISSFKEKLNHMKLKGVLKGFIWSFLSFLMAFLIWYFHGIDPKRSSIIPRFKSPKDLSPAAVNYVYLGRYDNDAFSSALISMAIKGHIIIDNESFSVKVLEGDNKDLSQLSEEEKIIYNNFIVEDQGITLSKSNRIRIKKTVSDFKNSLKQRYSKYHSLNIFYTLIVVGFTFFAHFMSVRPAGEAEYISFIGVLEYMAVGFVVGGALFKRSTSSRFKRVAGAIMVTGFLLFHGGMFGAMPRGGGIDIWIQLAILAIPSGFFICFMPSPTRKGQRLIDKIEGLKMYLSMAETHRLEKLNPPEMTIQTFETFLPYAHSLGEANSWADGFENVLKRAQDNDSYRGRTWYRGSYSGMSAAAIATSIGSAISSSVASSSSSSSSGGSSGGGGGGGGGGGW